MRKSTFSYQEFKNFMKRYENESTQKSFVKVGNPSPYRYKKVFDKDKKHEIKRSST